MKQKRLALMQSHMCTLSQNGYSTTKDTAATFGVVEAEQPASNNQLLHVRDRTMPMKTCSNTEFPDAPTYATQWALN